MPVAVEAQLAECPAELQAEARPTCEQTPFELAAALAWRRPPTPAMAPLLKLGQTPPPLPAPAYRVIDLHVDHLGSVRLTTDELGQVTARHDFLPFGEEINPIVPSPDANTRMFTGHERDRETGMDYMLARSYGVTGRFLSVDPIGGALEDPQSWNRYSYVLNQPLAFIDVDGRVVVGAQVITSGPNAVPLRPRRITYDIGLSKKAYDTLGLKRGPLGWAMAVNVRFVTSADDRASNYAVKQRGVSTFEDPPGSGQYHPWVSADAPVIDNPRPGNQFVDPKHPRVMTAFDAPSAIVNVSIGGMPAGFTGGLVSYFRTEAVDAAGNPSGPTLFWKVTIVIRDGKATGTVTDITETEYSKREAEHKLAERMRASSTVIPVPGQAITVIVNGIRK